CTFFVYISPYSPNFYPLSLHDALPIYLSDRGRLGLYHVHGGEVLAHPVRGDRTGRFAWGSSFRRGGAPAKRGSPSKSPRPIASQDRKSTRLNSSHVATSYAVFCL